MNKIWFTSDTHFGSQRTLELSKRPFTTVEEMDEVMIENWNNVVSKNDIVYHLGDFGDYEKVKRLNGIIMLILGNYEEKDGEQGKLPLIDNKYLLLEGFDKILGRTNQVSYSNRIINLSHEPSKVKDKKIDEINVDLFGHIHKLCMIKPYGLNVGVDCHNFKPIDMETVLFYHNAILNHYDNEVFN
ncbi:hypothetical protein MXT59_13135 [Clostridioides difficile]|nr:hypothetical protein [Clostridioides difficile]MCK1917571.1 hypothetical protein [Clostridioides difficile]